MTTEPRRRTLTADEAQELVDQFAREHSYAEARDLMRFIRPAVETIVAARIAEAQAGVHAVLDKINALHPDQFKTGPSYLSPAFREIDYRAAFMALAELTNELEKAAEYDDNRTEGGDE